MAYVVMADVVMAYVVMADIVMAYVVMAIESHGAQAVPWFVTETKPSYVTFMRFKCFVHGQPWRARGCDDGQPWAEKKGFGRSWPQKKHGSAGGGRRARSCSACDRARAGWRAPTSAPAPRFFFSGPYSYGQCRYGLYTTSIPKLRCVEEFQSSHAAEKW